MRLYFPSLIVLVTALVLTVAAQLSATPPKGIKDIVYGESVFVDDPTVGKDPFFPRSTRKGRVNIIKTNEPIVVLAVPDLFLKGIAVQKNKRVALINTATFEQGEESELRVGDRRVKVKCLEIRERTVLVSIDGTMKELTLRNGL